MCCIALGGTRNINRQGRGRGHAAQVEKVILRACCPTARPTPVVDFDRNSSSFSKEPRSQERSKPYMSKAMEKPRDHSVHCSYGAPSYGSLTASIPNSPSRRLLEFLPFGVYGTHTAVCYRAPGSVTQ